jgi:hypothetical protein
MNGVRRIVDDLLDKRLWPGALLLVVALVAIPLVIGGGGSSDDAGDGELAATPAAAARQTSAPAVELVGPPAVRTRPGKLRDPFRRTKKAKQADAKTSGSAASAKSSTKASNADSSTGGASTKAARGSGKTSRAPAKVTSPTNVPTLASRSVYEVSAHFAGASYDYEHPLQRLAVLGEEAGPALLYLGVSRGGEYAVFLLGPDATAGGDDGACIVADSCRAIGLRKGDKLGVDVVGADAAVRHYELEVAELRRLHLSSATRARAWRARVDPIGVEVRSNLAQDPVTAAVLGRLHFTARTGTVSVDTAP